LTRSILRRQLHGPGMWGSYADAVLPGLGVVEGGQTSTGSAVAWFRRLVSCGELGRKGHAQGAGVRVGS
ncbi:unnamed protein product, partial [Hapterophycus canaliculatus]